MSNFSAYAWPPSFRCDAHQFLKPSWLKDILFHKVKTMWMIWAELMVWAVGLLLTSVWGSALHNIYTCVRCDLFLFFSPPNVMNFHTDHMDEITANWDPDQNTAGNKKSSKIQHHRIRNHFNIFSKKKKEKSSVFIRYVCFCVSECMYLCVCVCLCMWAPKCAEESCFFSLIGIYFGCDAYMMLKI